MSTDPLRVEHLLYESPGETVREPWWHAYAARLDGLTMTARAALEADCRFIIERGVLAPDRGIASWPPDQVRTGLVMGSVQSGKTASMFGVSALAIDHGVDVVVVLAGTRVSLWKQTYKRLLRQLDPRENDVQKRKMRLLCPKQGVADEGTARLSTLYMLPRPEVRRKLKDHRPLVIVAMKQVNHLHALGRSLRDNVFNEIGNLGRPVHMLVLDDEADDGSILDAMVEASEDPVFGNLKQIPRAIANLWDDPKGPPSNLRTTYVAYTATPQANLLQEGHNPLAPRDFLVSLRTPLDIGHMVDVEEPGNLNAPRSSTYPDPAGLPSFYTGGEVFYRRGECANLCRPLTADPDDDRAEAIRAFLVAGAIRLHRSGLLGPATAAAASFDSPQQARETVMTPHSMLYHPSASIEDHFESAENLLVWAGVSDRRTARRLLDDGAATLPDALVAQMDADPAPWAAWLDQYRNSAAAIENEFNVLHPSDFPDWSTVRDILASEIIPGTRVSVVNSDPSADDRPSYEPERDQTTGRWRAPRDLCTIFVSGNVMARGLTLEGMTTVLFQRSSNKPLADTQMQMQRWFGYRGSYVELCRVFASQAQLELFRDYHDTDEAIRAEITECMMGSAPEPSVLQGSNFNATGKIANFRQYPLSPGGRPFITVLNAGSTPDPNAKLVAELFAAGSSSAVSEGPRLLGQILDEPLSLLEAANWLDRLRYDAYAPGDGSDLAKLWLQTEKRVSAQTPLTDGGLYRPPLYGGSGDPPRKVCPYSIAAYLRLWSACLTRPVNGLFVIGEPKHLWSMADLQSKQARAPRFWVGIRFGDGQKINDGPLSTLPFGIRATDKNVGSAGELTTTWGTSTPTADPGQFRGDLFFDYHHRNVPPPSTQADPSWRPIGSDGQILIYVNQRPGQPHPAVAFGLCLPAGGPEQFSATRATTILP